MLLPSQAMVGGALLKPIKILPRYFSGVASLVFWGGGPVHGGDLGWIGSNGSYHFRSPSAFVY